MSKRIHIICPAQLDARVDRNGPIPEHAPELGPCWIWTSTKHPTGYGYYQNQLVHRWMMQMKLGRALPPEICVCHRCDNRICLRLDHLFLGTRADNAADRNAKGRTRAPNRRRVGIDHHKAKLTEDDVRVIRSRVANGETRTAVAASFGVTNSLVSAICLRQFWQHVV